MLRKLFGIVLLAGGFVALFKLVPSFQDWCLDVKTEAVDGFNRGRTWIESKFKDSKTAAEGRA